MYGAGRGNKSQVYEALERYFKKLDHAPLSPSTILSSENDKERYETAFMYAFRKYAAAEYHYRRVSRFIEAEKAHLEDTPPIDFSGLSVAKGPNIQLPKGVFKFQMSADHYVYELSAFLEALKSSLDFIAAACSPHLRGIEMDSISTLIRLVRKDQSGPILDQVKGNIEWLERLREYRHHVVHRRVISAASGHEVHTVGDSTKKVRHPVVIPVDPPAYIPDTRHSRMLDDVSEDEGNIPGLSRTSSEVSVSTDDVTLFRDFSVEYRSAPGWIAIEEFMKSHLDTYESFFMQLIEALTELDFTAYSPT